MLGAAVTPGPPRIYGPVKTICQRLGLEPNLVAKLTLTPSTATAVVYKLREDGAKYIDETGEAAVETHTYRVRSY